MGRTISRESGSLCVLPCSKELCSEDGAAAEGVNGKGDGSKKISCEDLG